MKTGALPGIGVGTYISMASNEAVLLENAVSKLYYSQVISIGVCTFLNEHFQLVQFHLKPSIFFKDSSFVF